MISQLTHLNWFSVLCAFIPYFILGGLWFTVFFGNPYKTSLGKGNETLPNSPIFIAGPAICCLIITITTAMLIYALNVNTLSGALEFAMVAGIGYLVTNTVNIAINPNIPRPIFYSVISGTYHLVGITIVCIIIVAMK
ncbi:DUF1761 family protein [Pedobacter petrophilus]|uniref:DUF1761 family protein n=1 Tax=Pedobacter petrophilus TaxID=1908241 RepID=A0A7K0FY86_9SPHI|nr:DUF1761 family protein [Pedobacter petrophilus]